MNKSVPLISAFGLCLLALPVGGRAQAPVPSPQGAAAAEAPDDAAPDADGDTKIFDMLETTFSAKDRVAVFRGSVIVKDPRFNISCDELTVYLSKGVVSAAMPSSVSGTTPPPIDPPAKAGDEKPSAANRSSGLDHAVAKGHVIIVQKHASTKADEEEKVSIGRADTAEYDSKTGDITLRGMPKVEQNGDSHEALSRSTWMVLHSDNSLETHGPSSTHIAPRGNNNNLPGGKPGGSPPTGSPSRRTTQNGKQS